MSASDWTEEREQKLRVLWMQGLSCSQIAAQLNAMPGGKLTRNAVIGKRVRLHLPDRGERRIGSDAHRAKRVRAAAKAARPIPRPKYTQPELKAEPSRRGAPLHAERPNAVVFINREPEQCAMFLDGEEGAYGLVCGEPVSINRFCAACAKLAYQPIEPPKKRKAA